MKKSNSTILVILIVISLIIIYTLTSTYAIIINVKEENGIQEIVNIITLRDLLTNEDGTYNGTYYDVTREIPLTEEEANLIMDSNKLNENLQIVLNSVVDYKLNNNISAKLSNDYIYNLILDGVNNTNTLSEELKTKVINKAYEYKQDISNYVYDIEVKLIEGDK